MSAQMLGNNMAPTAMAQQQQQQPLRPQDLQQLIMVCDRP